MSNDCLNMLRREMRWLYIIDGNISAGDDDDDDGDDLFKYTKYRNTYTSRYTNLMNAEREEKEFFKGFVYFDIQILGKKFIISCLLILW